MAEFEVDRGGWSLHTVRVGPEDCRRAVLALHGGPGLSHESLRPLDALAGPRRCVIHFDQRGNGLSGAPAAPWTRDDLVADVEAVREAWGLRRLDVIGHSWGAYLAMAYAAEHKRRVRRLVLSSPAPLTLSGWRDFEAEMRRRIRAYRAEGLIPRPAPAVDDDCAEHTADVLPAYLFDPTFEPLEERDTTCSRAVFGWTWAALPRGDLAGLASESHKRARLVQGEGEATGPAIRDEWERYYGGRLKIEVLPACGHVLHTECPERWLEELDL